MDMVAQKLTARSSQFMPGSMRIEESAEMQQGGGGGEGEGGPSERSMRAAPTQEF